MANIEEKVEMLLQSKIEEMGYELYDVEYAKEGKNYFLRIFIDKDDGIDLNDCEKVNDGIMDLLDEADYIKEQYFLEVSSPGIERNLRKDKHLNKAMGEKIEVNLFKPMDKKKSLEGILTGYDEDSITMMYENDEITIERKDIALMKTKYNWD
ncbi:MAG: ribosome maturation factor RimP [Clostridia bacterium]|nr:ribosome maturation factor RimP [Clostridia bacterium]